MSTCRAALARSKGWAPRPLPQPKLQPTAGITLADSTPTSAAAAVSGGTQSGAAAVQPMPWQNLGLRFTTAPVVDDEDMMSDAQAGNVYAHNQLAESADQVRHSSAVEQHAADQHQRIFSDSCCVAVAAALH